ncbi:helix-turn-helix transcriptional regulator [Salinithrix halophila]|uniref:Helix-turn-helix transcriptional regulator n=1 Tax=Salinithrix halophila TaxID=1485204 RepID=A0ABV8JE99_9BACL
MRADRLLRILLMLNSHQPVTANQLAERMEVSKRTIYRDIDDLNGAGIPIYAVRGQQGGFLLNRELRERLSFLNHAEIRDLFINRLPGPLIDLGAGKNFETALRKILEGLPVKHRHEADQLYKRVHLDPVHWFQEKESVPWLPAIESAMWENRCIQLTYSFNRRVLQPQIVRPYGLVAKSNIWYMVGATASEMDIHVYRVSQVQYVKVTSERFVCPKAFDLAQYWIKWCLEHEHSQAYSVIVKVPKRHVARVQEKLGNRIQHIDSPFTRNGKMVFNVHFLSEEDALGHLLQLGERVKVIEPDELGEKMVNRAKQILSLY